MKKVFSGTGVFFSQDKNVLILSFLLLLIFSLPLLLLGGNVPYEVWDNLDSNVVWRKLIIDNYLIFADNSIIVHQMMDAPRASFGDGPYFILLAKVFPPATSLALNRFLQIMIGFTGMFLLCRRYITKDNGALPAAIVAILFAILPFWSSGGLSIAAQPLVLYSFLRIRDSKNTKLDWIIIVLYPFVSSLIVYGFFFYVLLFALFCIDWYRTKKLNLSLLFALVALSTLSLLMEWRNVLGFFIANDFVSHRTEFAPAYLSLRGVIDKFIVFCFHGQNHAPSNHSIILFISLFVFICSWVKYRKANIKFGIVLSLLFLIAAFASVIHWAPIKSILESVSFFRMFQIDRFYTLFPLLVFIAFAFAVNEISKLKLGKFILLALFMIQILFSIKNDYTYSGLIKKAIGKNDEKTITFNEFYSESLFDSIKGFIGKPENSYKVAALGFHPATLQYNGFYTIDGYCANYDLKYKHRFGKLLANEFAKNKSVAQYFNRWGSRCYVFDDKGGRFDTYRSEVTETESLDLDYDILKSMNCQYIISSVKILNQGDHLDCISVFENEVWKIYLYKVI
ncbi:MAG: DUF6044 family protein [Prevotella sp.]|jgi:hypothetical protein|nr:DUF6044 family protein [Prevotella sp.]